MPPPARPRAAYRRTISICLWVIVVLSLNGKAAAQQDPTPTAPTPPTEAPIEEFNMEDLLNFEVQEVAAVSKRAEKATDAPAAVYVITKEDIRVRGYAFLKDVLRDLPGMETTEYYSGEIGTQAPVRGIAGNNKIIVLVNGARVNPPGGEAMMLRSDLSVRNAERIEVIYGPGSTLYGQDAISLVINIQTRTPPKGDDAPQMAFGLGGGYPLRGESWATWSQPFSGGSLTAHIHYFQATQLTNFKSEYPDEWNANYQPNIDARGGVGSDPQRWDQGLNAHLQVIAGDSSVQIWHRQSSVNSSEGFVGVFAKIDEAVWSDMSTMIEARNALPLLKDDILALESSIAVNRYEIQPDSRYVFAVGGPAPLDRSPRMVPRRF